MRKIVYLLVSIGLVTGYLWIDTLTPAAVEQGYNACLDIVYQVAPNIRQRVLTPFLVLGDGTLPTYITRTVVLHFIAFPLWYVGLWLWLRRFGRYGLAVTFVSGLYIVLGFQAWGLMGAWSVIEMVCAVWLLVLIDRDTISLGVVAIATFNRPETAGVLALTYALYHGKQGKSYTMLLTWGALCLGLMWLLPGQGSDVLGVIQRNWIRNIEVWLLRGCTNMFLWGLFGVLAVIGWRRTTPRMRRITAAIVPYLILYLVSQAWYETRVLLTVYPLMGALAVVGLENNRNMD